MKAYLAILSAQGRTLLQYRLAALASMTTNMFFGLIQVMVFAAFYRSSTAVQPMTLPEVITYIWLGQALIGLFPWNVDPDIRQLIRSGGVAYELLRPLRLYNLWFARAVARRTVPTLLRGVPLVIIAGLFFELQAPPTLAAAVAWIVATAGALVLSCAITNLLSISLLWTISGQGITYLVSGAVSFFSGMFVPLPLFPPWSQALLNALPFRGLIDIPFRLYIGHIPANQCLGLLAEQLLWAFALIGLGHWLLHRGSRRLVVQGG